MRELVFVHGRSQQHKDSIALKQEWIAAWKEGLAKSGLQMPIPESAIHFPYYGNTLYDLVRDAPDVAEVIVRGSAADTEQQQFIADIVHEIARAKGVDETAMLAPDVIEKGPLNWGWVHAILKAIDPVAGGASIALFTNDVYHYLNSQGIRDRIEMGVREAFTSANEMVVVAHSLGTIVVYNLLRRDGETANWKVPLFVTVGCPLAISRIKRALQPISFPTCARKWFNALDPGDVVALYPLDKKCFADLDPAIENKTDVVNQTSNQHGISGYLNDKEVAKRIHDALI